MSTLTYTNTDFSGAKAGSAAGRKPLWRRILDGVIRSRQLRAEREIAAYVKSHGDLLTDDMEREIMERLTGRRGSLS